MSKPIQYIKGYVEFYKLKFKVTPDVLIPRPETELLVDTVLELYEPLTINHKLLTILDLGTGSGNIIISICKNLPGVKGLATDISPKALKIARQNAKFHGVEERIEFIKSDLLDAIASLQHDNLVIVTNLPYIPSARIPILNSSVKDFEPHIALDGGEDGFDLYRKLFTQLVDQKNKFKVLTGEIDYSHGQLAIDEAFRYFPQAEIEVKQDLAKKQRILLIRRLN